METSISEPQFSEALKSSPLLQAGGYKLYRNLFTPQDFSRLQQEAFQRQVSADPVDLPAQDGAYSERGGFPARKFLINAGSTVQDGFYFSNHFHDFIAKETGSTVVPTGYHGTYSYYVRDGDFLSLHRDTNTCDLAVITCLYDNAVEGSDGGKLCLYPNRTHESLAYIQTTPDQGQVSVRLNPGVTIFLLGGLVPHYVTPIAHGQTRIISAMCFRILF